MSTRLTFIPPQTVKIASAYRLDLSQYVTGGVHLAPGSTTGVVRLWKVNLPSLTNAGEIPFGNAAGKDDSVAIEILRDGSLLVTVSEALPGMSGSTAAPEVYVVPGVFPAFAGFGSSAVDTYARQQIAAIDARLDRIASGAAG